MGKNNMKVKEEGIVFNFGFKVDSIKCLKNGNKNFSTMIHLYIKEKIYQTSQEITLDQGSDPSYRYSGFLLNIKIYNIEKNLVLFLLIEYAHLPIHGALWADMGDHFVP